jgi:hypothetical protein
MKALAASAIRAVRVRTAAWAALLALSILTIVAVVLWKGRSQAVYVLCDNWGEHRGCPPGKLGQVFADFARLNRPGSQGVFDVLEPFGTNGLTLERRFIVVPELGSSAPENVWNAWVRETRRHVEKAVDDPPTRINPNDLASALSVACSVADGHSPWHRVELIVLSDGLSFGPVTPTSGSVPTFEQVRASLDARRITVDLSCFQDVLFAGFDRTAVAPSVADARDLLWWRLVVESGGPAPTLMPTWKLPPRKRRTP